MNRFCGRLTLGVLVLAFSLPAFSAVKYVIWWKEKGSSTKNMAALDLSTGKVVWEKKLPDSVNFVVERPEGILVGCDNGCLYLLNPQDGSQVWMAKLGKEVNEFHGADDDGFLVSHDKQSYWLVGSDGKVKAYWR